MNIKDFAKSRNLTIPKTKQLCEAVLGEIPKSLASEQIQKLDSGLACASQSLLSPSKQEKDELISANISSESVEKVKEIVGIRTLQKNLQLYLQLLKSALLAKKFEQDTLAFQAEQAFYNDLGCYQQKTFNESLERMNKASQATTFDGLRNYQPNPNDSEDSSLHQEILSLMNTLGL